MKILSSFLFVLTLLFSQEVTVKKLDPYVVKFFNTLKYKSSSIGYDVKTTPKWEKNRFSKYISNFDGLEITDVNNPRKIYFFDKKEIEEQIKQRKGRAFRALSHLGYLIEDYYNYKRFKGYTLDSSFFDRYIVLFGNFYILYFHIGSDDKYKLFRISYETLTVD